MVNTLEHIQWHPGFYGAVELELRSNDSELQFNMEYGLSKKPLSMDMMIVEKNVGTMIENEIGRIFRKYNVIEYKSPDDNLSIDDFYKTLAYAYLFKSLGKKEDVIKIEEISVSLFRSIYPKKLFRKLQDNGYRITRKYPGIYYVSGYNEFPIQIIVMEQLDAEKHSILRVLSRRASIVDIERFLNEVDDLEEQGDVENINAVLQVSIHANPENYEIVRRKEEMCCQALKDLFADEFLEVQQEAEKKVREANREYRKLRREIKADKERLKASEEKIKESEEKIKESEEKIKESEEKIKESEEKIKESEEKINESEEKIKESEEKINDQNKIIKNQENEISSLKAQLAMFRNAKGI